MRTLQKRGGGYQVPEIEIVDVKVEAGFAGRPRPESLLPEDGA